jgi:hypothetical protein
MNKQQQTNGHRHGLTLLPVISQVKRTVFGIKIMVYELCRLEDFTKGANEDASFCSVMWPLASWPPTSR